MLQLSAAVLFITCAISISLSAKNHRWLFYNGIAVVIAYILISISGQGDGTIAKYIGGMVGVIGGLLIIRGGFQRETGKQYKLFFPLNLSDRYPLATAGTIEGTSASFIAVGAYLNGDYTLSLVAALWVIAHCFLIASDEFLRNKIKTVKI
ncbi:MAG: hypothetical protein AAF569_04415 [Pseudomonadota bacterium]